MGTHVYLAITHSEQDGKGDKTKAPKTSVGEK